MRAPVLVLSAALLLAIVPAAPAQEPEPSPCPPEPAVYNTPGGLLRIPPGAQPGRTPLVVFVVPGGVGDYHDTLRLGAEADRAGFAVLYPQGNSFWELNDRHGRGDVRAVTRTLDHVLAAGCVDRDRVSITGVSNGAGFAVRMACELPTRFDAVVPVAAGLKALEPCPRSARASFLAIHGTADTSVPYLGARPDFRGSVPRHAAAWARRVGCSARTTTTVPRRRVARIRHRSCPGGRRVEILRLDGTTHGWPGAAPRQAPARNPSGVSAAREVMAFLRAVSR